MKKITYVAMIINLDDHTQVLANVHSDGHIERWGAPVEDIALTVDATEAVAKTITDA